MCNPADLGLAEFVESLDPIEFVDYDLIAVLLPEPVVERSLAASGGSL
ncbi:hypothetical protein [Rhodococcus marinonascens]|nr:hypothetical protein [Rhodococcus marinonascens]